jgi:putative phosphoesterase
LRRFTIRTICLAIGSEFWTDPEAREEGSDTRAMLVGLLSDSHDRVDATSIAVQMLLAEGAEYLLHCGDLGSRRALDCFKGLAAGFVWGENDRDRMGLLRYADSLQLQCFGVLGDFALEERRIAITHGDDRRLLKRLIAEGQHDFLLHGHVAELKDETHGGTRVITPGVLHGGTQRTAVLLDTISGDVKVIRVPDNV